MSAIWCILFAGCGIFHYLVKMNVRGENLNTWHAFTISAF